MKTIATTIAITMLLLASVSEAQPEPQPQQSSRCIMAPPICMAGQRPICVCQDDYSLNCMWMCGSAR